jgi:lysozyme
MASIMGRYCTSLTLIKFVVGFCLFGFPALAEDTPPSMMQIEILEGSLAGAPPNANPRKITKGSVEVIKHFEKYVATAYDDPAGYCTIGFGHLIKKARCASIDLSSFQNGLSYAEAETLMMDDTIEARLAVQKHVTVSLNKWQYSALVSFVFNVGEGNFGKSTLLKKVNRGNFDEAQYEFQRWKYANGKVYRGLIRRRECEVALFLGKIRLAASGSLDPSSCVELGAAPANVDLTPIDIYIGE